MKTVTLNELINRDIGKKGTPARDKFDAKVQSVVIASQLKQLRQDKNITQQQLAEMVGIDKGACAKYKLR